MNGAHDLGGMMGFGPIAAPASEPVFHEKWEGRMAALMMAVPGDWNIDEDRSACESMHPAKYLKTSEEKEKFTYFLYKKADLYGQPRRDVV